MFGELLRGYRQSRAITQEELAEQAGVSARHVRDLEAGRTTRPRHRTVRGLADALGLAGIDRERFHRAALATAAPAATGPGPGTPAQLPMDVAGFTGRADELARLDAFLGPAGVQPAGVIVLVLSGSAGVGKTTLAVHWAQRMRRAFPDGQLYVDLRGFDPCGSVTPPAEVVGAFLEALGVLPERIPDSLDARSALYRSLLAGRRMLVVLDNARDSAQVRPLLPGSPGCLVLVTSRDRLSSLVAGVGAASVVLDLMTAAEARQLLAHRLGARRVDAEADAVSTIIECCARLPLALTVVAARAAGRPDLPLATLAAELRAGNGSLERFTDPDPAGDVRAAFSWSYRTLGATTALTFRLLGVHPGPDIGIPAAASLAGISLTEAGTALDELARAHLVAETGPGRYAMHDLLRAYAAELAGADPATRDEALPRMLDHYLHTACAAVRRLAPYRDQIPLSGPRPGVSVPEVPDHGSALDWFGTEYPVLLTAVRQAAGGGLDDYAVKLAWAVATFLDRRGKWHDMAAVQEVALAATRRLGSRRAEAEAERLLGLAAIRLGRYAAARDHLTAALDISTSLGDDAHQGHCQMHLAQVSARRLEYADALAHARRAQDRFQAAGHRYGYAHSFNSIGWYLAQLGRYQDALAAGGQALPLLEGIGDAHGRAAAWDTIGYAHHRSGDLAQAIVCYRRAVELYEEAGDRFHEADSLVHLGDAEAAAGDGGAARRTWRRALAILDEIGHSLATAVDERLRRQKSTSDGIRTCGRWR